uniref:Uncharacterized protein n=1 Tax=Ceratitis capitata TaxID=7213 RepID=W8CB03_CERCA
MPNDDIKIKTTSSEKKKMRALRSDAPSRAEVKRCRNVEPKPERTTIKKSVLTDNGYIEKDGIFFCGPPASPEGADTPQTSRGSSYLKLTQEEIKLGITQYRGSASSDSGVSVTGSEVQTQESKPPCKRTCRKPPSTPPLNTSNHQQRLVSPPNEKFPTIIKSGIPIKASTPMVLMEYVSTPTSAIKGIRKRRLNFGEVEEEENESLPRRRTKIVEVPKRKETKNTKKLNKTIR